LDALRFLSNLQGSPEYAGQVQHVQTLEAREAQFGELELPLPEPLQHSLQALGIESFYTHQCEAIDAARNGQNIVVQTGTASGKTLCYNVPVIEALLADPNARALYLFPTKALAQDQLRLIQQISERDPTLKKAVSAGTYDGDTPQGHRRKVRDGAAIILSNPDMLHAGILPGHPRWAKFFANLRYVVIDELHTYRGIFGSNVANVIRRLRRICDFYRAKPQFVTCSATMANPKELAQQIIGEEVRLIDQDGSPRGTKYFVLWNPPETGQALGTRRSPNVEAHSLLVKLAEEQVQSIVFTRARVIAELIYRYARDALEEGSPKLVDRLRPYRGGYLAEARREIERQLFSGELLGVTATNALELGIDVGGVDACILVGFPGSIASTWQQAGRAGRRSEESLVFLIGHNDPIDQYLMRHSEFLFGQSPENAIVDPDNVYILSNHIMCAAVEMPLKLDDERFFGPLVERICEIIEEEGMIKRVGDKWYWASSDEPSRKMSLRTMSTDNFSITDTTEGGVQVIGEIDGYSAFETVYPGAVYLHAGESYLVRDLDLDTQNAVVEQQETDYYTWATVVSRTRAGEKEGERGVTCARLSFGDLEVTRQVLGYSRIRLYSQENMGHSELDLPPRTLETKGMWVTFDPGLVQDVGMGALIGMKNVVRAVLPMVAMCDRADVGANVNTDAVGEPALFMYDRYPGGLGFCQKAYEMAEELFEASLQLVEECSCEDGCPSCVGQPLGLGALVDIGPDEGAWPESRSATMRLLRRICQPAP